jgi:3,4-dihydroxy 2-butanone 4-phosphate synthase/GTP cyclohydrolase II
MSRLGRDLVRLAMTGERHQQQLPLMVEQNTSKFGTAFTVSIDARRGVTKGISAAGRASTIRTAIDRGLGALILKQLGAGRIRLITSHSRRIVGL